MLHRIYHTRDKNSYYGQKIGNKNIHQEGKQNDDQKHPEIALHMDIKLTNHRKVGKGAEMYH